MGLRRYFLESNHHPEESCWPSETASKGLSPHSLTPLSRPSEALSRRTGTGGLALTLVGGIDTCSRKAGNSEKNV